MIPAVQVDTIDEIRPADNSTMENPNTENLNGYTSDMVPTVQTPAATEEKAMTETVPEIRAQAAAEQQAEVQSVEQVTIPTAETVATPQPVVQPVLPPIEKQTNPNKVQTVELIENAEEVVGNSRSVVSRVQVDKPANYTRVTEQNTIIRTRKDVERERNIQRYFAIINEEE